ncbi:MAG: hypothetical protein ACRDVP_07575 [Acidimicrobiales bacterium]
MDQDFVDPVAILDELRSRLGTVPDPVLADPRAQRWGTTSLVADGDLAYLHSHWNLAVAPSTTARPGLKGWVARRLVALVARLCEPQVAYQKDMTARLLRVANALAQRCDELSAVVLDQHRAQAGQFAQLVAWLDDRHEAPPSGDG